MNPELPDWCTHDLALFARDWNAGPHAATIGDSFYTLANRTGQSMGWTIYPIIDHFVLRLSVSLPTHGNPAFSILRPTLLCSKRDGRFLGVAIPKPVESTGYGY